MLLCVVFDHGQLLLYTVVELMNKQVYIGPLNVGAAPAK